LASLQAKLAHDSMDRNSAIATSLYRSCLLWNILTIN
jgi:hypothetical protein